MGWRLGCQPRSGARAAKERNRSSRQEQQEERKIHEITRTDTKQLVLLPAAPVRLFSAGSPLQSFLFLLMVGGDAFRKRVSVDSEHRGGLREVLFVPRQRLFDIQLFKFGYRFFEKNVAFQHLLYQIFEAVMNHSTIRSALQFLAS